MIGYWCFVLKVECINRVSNMCLVVREVIEGIGSYVINGDIVG